LRGQKARKMPPIWKEAVKKKKVAVFGIVKENTQKSGRNSNKSLCRSREKKQNQKRTWKESRHARVQKKNFKWESGAYESRLTVGKAPYNQGNQKDACQPGLVQMMQIHKKGETGAKKKRGSGKKEGLKKNIKKKRSNVN